MDFISESIKVALVQGKTNHLEVVKHYPQLLKKLAGGQWQFSLLEMAVCRGGRREGKEIKEGRRTEHGLHVSF
jgi:hypothetical protein